MKRNHKRSTSHRDEATVIPLFGKDEMNLIEFPFGPVTPNGAKTLEVEHETFDKSIGQVVMRRLIITGADAFGLPRPVDDQVLIGMKTLTYERGMSSQEIHFSRYELCRAIGWEPDGRAYHRLEESLDRIAGTTLKFKDAWWDKGEKEWKSRTFHLIESVSLCSRDELDRKRKRTGVSEQKLCSFVWNDVVWKSLQDGFIKTLDMALFRRIAKGRRREVPLRLFRILDKRFHFGDTARFELERLCVGTLGLSGTYNASQMHRVLKRSAKVLIECGFLASMQVDGHKVFRSSGVVFKKASAAQKKVRRKAEEVDSVSECHIAHDHRAWMDAFDESTLLEEEMNALESRFGSKFERSIVKEDRDAKTPLSMARVIRIDFLRRFLESKKTVRSAA